MYEAVLSRIRYRTDHVSCLTGPKEAYHLPEYRVQTPKRTVVRKFETRT